MMLTAPGVEAPGHGAESVERRLGAEKLHDAYGTDRNKARIVRQQTQD